MQNLILKPKYKYKQVQQYSTMISICVKQAKPSHFQARKTSVFVMSLHSAWCWKKPLLLGCCIDWPVIVSACMLVVDVSMFCFNETHLWCCACLCCFVVVVFWQIVHCKNISRQLKLNELCCWWWLHPDLIWSWQLHFAYICQFYFLVCCSFNSNSSSLVLE